MAEASELSGNYVGRNRIRPGREDDLSPAERKRYEKDAERIPLELRDDGTFRHKGGVEGEWRLEGLAVRCEPRRFGGRTEAEMREAAEAMGRAFGLAWLFVPFDLVVEGETLRAGGDNTLFEVVYEKVR